MIFGRYIEAGMQAPAATTPVDREKDENGRARVRHPASPQPQQT
jgi:hypothetical protein